MKRKRTLTPLLCALTAAALLFSGCSGKTEPGGAPDPEDPPEESASSEGTAHELGSLKSFTAGTQDGGTFTQDDIASKDVTVVNVWALSCAPCIREMPDLAAFAEALPDNVQLITVCLDGYGNQDALQSVLDGAGFEGVTIISGDGDLATLCGNLMYTPTTVLADSEGNLAGDAIIGAQENLAEAYLEAVNAVLTSSGKAEISLEE